MTRTPLSPDPGARGSVLGGTVTSKRCRKSPSPGPVQAPHPLPQLPPHGRAPAAPAGSGGGGQARQHHPPRPHPGSRGFTQRRQELIVVVHDAAVELPLRHRQRVPLGAAQVDGHVLEGHRLLPQRGCMGTHPPAGRAPAAGACAREAPEGVTTPQPHPVGRGGGGGATSWGGGKSHGRWGMSRGLCRGTGDTITGGSVEGHRGAASRRGWGDTCHPGECHSGRAGGRGWCPGCRGDKPRGDTVYRGGGTAPRRRLRGGSRGGARWPRMEGPGRGRAGPGSYLRPLRHGAPGRPLCRRGVVPAPRWAAERGLRAATPAAPVAAGSAPEVGRVVCTSCAGIFSRRCHPPHPLMCFRQEPRPSRKCWARDPAPRLSSATPSPPKGRDRW